MFDLKSIRFKIIAPLIVLISIIVLTLLVVGYRISKNAYREHLDYSVSKHAEEVKKIIEGVIKELPTSEPLAKEAVLEAKKRVLIDEIMSYWDREKLMGYIKTPSDTHYSHLASKSIILIEATLPEYGNFFIEKAITCTGGSVINLPIWNIKIVFIEKPIIPLLYYLSNDMVTAFMASISILGIVLIIVLTFFQLKNNLQKPLQSMANDVRQGNIIKERGVSEIDIIACELNKSLKEIQKRTEQYKTLHSVALSIHGSDLIDETLNIIIDNARIAISAELSALGLYTQEGKFKKLIFRGTTLSPGRLPDGKGILEFMRLSLVPVRIDNVMTHPAFSGRFPKNHPIIKNLLGYPIFSSDGRPIGALYFGNKEGGFTEDDEFMIKAICADASIAIERAEHVSELKRFKTVIETAFDTIIITNDKGHIVYVNPAFEKLTGYSREKVASKKTNILKSGYHDEGFYRELWDTITRGDIWKGEFINKKKNGELYYASAVIFPVRTEEGLNYVCIQRDITEEKKLYEQLLRAQKMEAIGTLAGGIAHDFNNLLTAILGYSELLLQDIREGTQFYKPVSIIHNAAIRGSELANKILTVTRKEKMEVKIININEIIRGSMELLRRSIPLNIEIITRLNESIPVIKADPGQIQQVIMNLAVNARDAMPEGGRLTIETDIVGKENGAANGLPLDKGGFIKISVSDTGTGIDAETQRRIFDPFFTTKGPGKGTGLGLYIVHSVITNHGGYINLYSEPSRGTRFNIYLPVAGNLSADEKSKDSFDIRGTETVLIIDDEADIRSLCKDILEPLGYTVLTAESGNKGIEVFREMKDKISVVILDMIMPKMSGPEVFQALRTISPDVRVLLCSGYSQNGFAGIDKLLSEGAAGFIQKPFTRQTLGQAIRRAISQPNL